MINTHLNKTIWVQFSNFSNSHPHITKWLTAEWGEHIDRFVCVVSELWDMNSPDMWLMTFRETTGGLSYTTTGESQSDPGHFTALINHWLPAADLYLAQPSSTRLCVKSKQNNSSFLLVFGNILILKIFWCVTNGWIIYFILTQARRRRNKGLNIHKRAGWGKNGQMQIRQISTNTSVTYQRIASSCLREASDIHGQMKL